METRLKGVLKSRYPNLRGQGWVKLLAPDDRKAFMHMVRSYGQHGHKGGVARAATAQRDKKGRFC